MKKVLEILRKHLIIIFIHILYSTSVFFIMYYNRKVMIPDIDKMTEIEFIKSAFFSETKRAITVYLISSLFLSIFYYFIANCVQNRKIYLQDFGKGILQYYFLTLASLILWIPLFVIFLMSIGIISIPSALIVIPLLSGQESLFIPAIVLWIVTLIFILFGILLFTLYITFWYPGIFLVTKNIFSAFKRSNKVVNDSCWKLLLFSLLLLVNFFGLIFINVYAFKLLYQSTNPLNSGLLWAGVVLTSIFTTILKIYSFVFLYERYSERDEKMEVFY
ncbi:MAG: hypothetical protein PWR27_983 [Petroclostridium sp.]|nr:hypothetical protein [Petroclostridium sp.]